MRKYLLPESGNFYKANLHTHSTVSDGKLTPEELKREYMARGYSIVAYTDHEIIVPHPELKDENFLPITGYEIAINDTSRWRRFQRTFHINVLCPEIERNISRTFCEKNASDKEHIRVRITDEMRKVGTKGREYSKEFVQKIIDMATEEGCLVTHNHPNWSLNGGRDYIGLSGFFGVEWMNTEANSSGFIDTMQPMYDYWREGEKMCYPLATDDCHSIRSLGKSFVMVKSKDLSYENVFSALKRGNFYSSTGPMINELYVEDGTVHMKLENAVTVYLSADHRLTMKVGDGQEELKEAVFSLDMYKENCENIHLDDHSWIRFDVIDKDGNYARTRAYFLEELQV